MSVENNILAGVQGLLIFCVGDKELSADMGKIITIIRLGEANFKSKKKFGNEVTHEGRLFEIIDINEILKIQMSQFTTDTRIILCEASSNLFGFIADKIIEIITLDATFEEKYLDWLPSPEKDYIAGDLSFQNRRVSLFDLDKLGRDAHSIKRYNFDIKQLEKNSLDS